MQKEQARINEWFEKFRELEHVVTNAEMRKPPSSVKSPSVRQATPSNRKPSGWLIR